MDCDHCMEQFNQFDRVAKMFPKCLHTICNKCALDQAAAGNQNCVCPKCGTLQDQEFSYETLPTNEKIMKILAQLMGGGPPAGGGAQ